MSYQEPSLQKLVARTNSDISTRLPGATPQLRRGLIPAIAYAFTKAIKALYGYMNWNYSQAVPVTALGVNLARWASMWGIYYRTPNFANGPIVAVGSNTSPISAGSVLQDQLGNAYTTNAASVIAGGVATIEVTAVVAGSAGNQAQGNTLTFVSPPTGVNAAVTVGSGGITGGTDPGDDTQLLADLLTRVQQPPHGGNANDYVVWAKSNSLTGADITRAWCLPLMNGPGTVGVCIVDDTYVGANLASPTEVTDVQTYIDSVRPVTVASIVGGVQVSGVTVFAAIPQPVAFAIGGGLTSAQQATVQAALAALFLREAAPPGAVGPDNTVLDGSIGPQDMVLAIANALGSGAFNMTAPVGTQTAAAQHILTLGAIAFS